jgi:hypothetical protein
MCKAVPCSAAGSAYQQTLVQVCHRAPPHLWLSNTMRLVGQPRELVFTSSGAYAAISTTCQTSGLQFHGNDTLKIRVYFSSRSEAPVSCAPAQS